MRRFVLEIYCEESRDVALVSRCIHVLECFSFNICCIRVVYLLLKLLDIVWIYCVEYCLWAQVAVLDRYIAFIGLFGT